jgi:predicted permease
MRPPRLALLLLWLRMREPRRSEVLDDLQELFDRRLQLHGPSCAARRYWRDVFSLCVPLRGAYTSTPSAPSPGKGSLMSAFAFELRELARAVRRQPAFFAIASATLAIGMAAHLSAFSLVDRLLLAPPAHIVDADRVFRFHVDRTDRSGRFVWFQTPFRSYQDLRATPGLFAGMAAYRSVTASIGTGLQARQITTVFADEHYFPLLGVSAALGRVFGPDENRPPSGTPVAVLGHDFWTTTFAEDPGVLGTTVKIGAVTYTVIGVAPRGFTGDTPDRVDAWAPLYAGAYELNPAWTTGLLFRSVNVLTRLTPGTTREGASSEAGNEYRRLVDGTPAVDPTARVILAPLNPGRTQQGTLNQWGRIALWIEGVALLVLLVALANVVNLQMSRAVQTRREYAVRSALGAGRGRLLLKLLLEMLLIAGVAGSLALVLSWFSAGALLEVLRPGIPAAGFGGGRLAAVAAITVIVGAAICATLAGLQLRTSGLAERLKSGRGGEGFSRERLRQGLLVTQVVVSALLLIGAGLFLRSVERLGALQFGHDHDRVLVVTMPLRGAGYETAAIEAFFDRALERVGSLPGVERVAAAQTMPFSPSQAAEIIVPDIERLPFQGYPTFYTVTPDFFSTMGMTVLRGRGFTQGDVEAAPRVLVLEESLARALWPDQDPIGRCIKLAAATSPCRVVVGVVSNTRRFVGTAEGSLRYYVPLAQRLYAIPPQALFVRTSGDPTGLIEPVRSALVSLDAGLPYAQIRTLREMSDPEKRPWRLGTTLFVLFGAAALVVASAGVYALLSFMVTQRSREIGVRLALGATPSGALLLVVRQSAGWVMLGLVLGTAVALLLGKFIEPMLFETSPYDVTVFAGTAALLGVIALVASLAPGIRASRVDPNTALRVE